MDVISTAGTSLPEGVTPLRVADRAPDLATPPVAIFVGSSQAHTAAAEALVAAGSVVLFARDLLATQTLLENLFPISDVIPRPSTQFTHGDFEIDLIQRRVTWRDVNLPVTNFEFRVLALLAQDRGRVLSFTELMRQVWDVSYAADAAPLRSLVKRLRKKLAHAGAGITIEAVRGIGYRLELIGPELPQ